MTPFERLLQQLPPERRVGAALVLENLSSDHDSPIYGLYAEFLAGLNANIEAMETRMGNKLAAIEQRGNQRDSQLAKDRAENVKTIRQEIGAFTEDKFWKRVIRSKVAGGITLAVCWVVGSYLLINSQIGAVKSSVDDLKAGQAATLAHISDNPQGIVDFANASIRAADKSNQTAATLAGIAALLATPDAIIGMKDGKLTLRIRSQHITIRQEEVYTHLQIHQDMPDIFGRVEDDLKEADKALLPKQK